ALLPTPLDRGPVERSGPRSRPVVLQGPRRAVARTQVAVSLGLVALDEGLPALQRPLLKRGPAATGSPTRGRGRTGSQRKKRRDQGKDPQGTGGNGAASRRGRGGSVFNHWEVPVHG